jgi:hypothetical protein
LYAGGKFGTAGGKASPALARALLTGLEARSVTYLRAPEQALEIALADMVIEVNGQPVTVVAAGPSEHGTAVTWDDTHLFYAPEHDRADSFSYTVSNGEHTATGVVTVSVLPADGLARDIFVGNGTATIQFCGIPGRSYDVQRATHLGNPVPWIPLTVTPLKPNADGSFTFTDLHPPAGTAYYRCVLH